MAIHSSRPVRKSRALWATWRCRLRVLIAFTWRSKRRMMNLNGGDVRMLVQGEALPKDSLAQLTLYPQAVIESADHALLLLRKVLQLIQSLGLTEREVRYLLTHAADFDGLNLTKLPTRATDD